MVQKVIWVSALLALGAPSVALAQEDNAGEDEPYELVCEARGSNGMVSMLLCPEGLSSDALAEEGRAICDGRAPCGAWVWTDAGFVPPEAPDAHDKLPKESVQNALAIWVHDTGQLITLREAASE